MGASSKLDTSPEWSRVVGVPRSTAAVAAIASVAACAHGPRGGAESLRTAAEAFHRQIQWLDLDGAAGFLSPGARGEFVAGVEARRDGQRLKVSDVEAEGAQLAADGATAQVVARVTWYRLPSVSARTETMITRWELRREGWQIVAIDGGPLATSAGRRNP